MLYPVREGLPFYVNLKLLEMNKCFPLNNQSKLKFFALLCIWCLMWNVMTIAGAMCLFVSSMIKQDYYLANSGLSVVVGACVVTAIYILFGVKHEMWSELLDHTIDCAKFGKSLNFDQITQQGDKMGKILYLCMFFIIVVVVVYEIFTEKACLLSDSGRNEMCGLMMPVWLPSGLASSVVFKRCVLLHQVFTLFVVTTFTAILCLQNQICEFIRDKVEHLSSVFFNKIDTAEAPTLQYQQFSFSMEYYQHVLKLCELFDSTSQKTLGHITLSTSVVMCLLLYNGMKGNYALVCYAVLFLLILAFTCYTGQTLEDAMSQVGDLLYLSRWYDYCIEIQKSVPLVIMRSQRFAGLRAVPIGRLNYLLFAAVIKTTYTYFNLMRGTGTR